MSAGVWSAHQQGWLQAMGYWVLDHGSALEMPEPVAAAPVAVPAPPPRATPTTVPPAPEFAPESVGRTREVKPAVGVPPAALAEPASTRPPAGTRRVSALRLPDRLQIALLRASGCDPSLPETQALMESWPVAQMRRDPAAKRALWPQLRALRKARRS